MLQLRIENPPSLPRVAVDSLRIINRRGKSFVRRTSIVGASQILAAAVAAGILPAVKGGIFATRTGCGQQWRERIFHRLAKTHARSRRAGSPARHPPRMADATIARQRVSCVCRKLRCAQFSDGHPPTAHGVRGRSSRSAGWTSTNTPPTLVRQTSGGRSRRGSMTSIGVVCTGLLKRLLQSNYPAL